MQLLYNCSTGIVHDWLWQQCGGIYTRQWLNRLSNGQGIASILPLTITTITIINRTMINNLHDERFNWLVCVRRYYGTNGFQSLLYTPNHLISFQHREQGDPEIIVKDIVSVDLLFVRTVKSIQDDMDLITKEKEPIEWINHYFMLSRIQKIHTTINSIAFTNLIWLRALVFDALFGHYPIISLSPNKMWFERAGYPHTIKLNKNVWDMIIRTS